MTDPLTLRKMKPEDLPRCMEILEKWNMAPVPETGDHAHPEPERSYIHLKNAIVALSGDRIVGVCSYMDRTETLAETANLAVDPEFQGKGVGYQLQKARLREMKERGFKRVRTETDRPATIQWYVRKFGYRIVKKIEKKYPFSLKDVHFWTRLEMDLEDYRD